MVRREVGEWVNDERGGHVDVGERRWGDDER